MSITTHPPIAATSPCLKNRGRLREATALLAAAALTSLSYAQTKPLNDTGITFCGGATSGNNSPCLATDPAGQDKHYGRDAAAIAGTLTKVGGSAGAPNGQPNGFDFTKVCNSGQAAGQGTCPANLTVPGYGADEWGCTRDNVTGLLWEVKTAGGLRSVNHTYTWYMTGSPDGDNGVAGGGSCFTAGRCDTERYSQDVNTTGLCGASTGWRVPTVKELEGIADHGRADPAIDPTFFPNTPSSAMWSTSAQAGYSGQAWYVGFGSGASNALPKSNQFQVRLVRGGQ